MASWTWNIFLDSNLQVISFNCLKDINLGGVPLRMHMDRKTSRGNDEMFLNNIQHRNYKHTRCHDIFLFHLFRIRIEKTWSSYVAKST